MARTMQDSVFELFLALPGTSLTTSHGAPTFKVDGKTFAHWAVNHHGDGRLALWLAMQAEPRDGYVDNDHTAYFVPPYVGVKGWLGVDLGAGLPWSDITARIYESWLHAAPDRADSTPPCPNIPAPERSVLPEEINPMLGAHAQNVLRGLRQRCLDLPETSPEDETGSATWRAGKRPFLRGRHAEGRLKLMFLVGVEQQAHLLDDPRYGLPPYYGPSGWVELDVQDEVPWKEIEALLEAAYRRVALKRMLKALDARHAAS